MRTIKSDELQRVVDNINPIINKLQRDIRKIKRHLNLTGTAGECTCPPTTLYPRGGMANEPQSIDVDCPVHGKSTWKTKTPDLPLHARVAKELGWKDIRFEAHAWIGRPSTWRPDTAAPVPDYPNDLVAARDAFDLYFELQCRKIDDRFDYWIERFYKDGWKWRVRLGFADQSVVADSLEEGFCLAIVAHHEQNK